MLKEYNRRWHIFGTAGSDGKLLNFVLDRINTVIPLPKLRYQPYSGDLRRAFEGIVGVTLLADSPVLKIELWVSDDALGYVTTKPIHESQRPLPTPDARSYDKPTQCSLVGIFYG